MTALEKAEKEIAEGKLGIARDRLHGLVLSHPQDLTLRSRLGDVYWKLGYPHEAGRFWFLDPDPGEEKLAAIALFIKQCEGDPARILHRLKLTIHPEDPMADQARSKVDELIRECKERGLPVPTWPPKHSAMDKAKANFGYIACSILGIAAVVLMLLGIAKAIELLTG
jgi:hypothetical protein